MKTITLEEHFFTESYLKAAEGDASVQFGPLQPKLLDLGAGRIAAMDEAGIDVQVLSLAAFALEGLNAATGTVLARDVNDELAAAVKANPTRLAGFATVALKDVGAAVVELERCVTKLGFVGLMLNGTVDGKFMDEPEFLPVFEAAARLGVPVYLHPAPPPKTVKTAYFSGLPGELGMLLSIAGWGWHAETGLHTLRMIVSGLFDKVPGLQLVIGHMGEGLPFALARSSGILSGAAKLQRPVAEYFKTNIHLTTSGYFTLPPLECALEVVGIERMMYSVDYPFSPNTKGRDFLEKVAGILSAEDMERLVGGNAKRLLGLEE
ncbi:amidohydrolase family protein [Granulicella sp. L60]|uniref:amidohydrolase family protein n=1 Tax=Granulicella sp. L60 TaxID=1641866 RepID=UPI00131E6F63|nr:amidohydrolase family protein [Granulicella sp. L60]